MQPPGRGSQDTPCPLSQARAHAHPTSPRAAVWTWRPRGPMTRSCWQTSPPLPSLPPPRAASHRPRCFQRPGPRDSCWTVPTRASLPAAVLRWKALGVAVTGRGRGRLRTLCPEPLSISYVTSLSPLSITRRMKSVLENSADVWEQASPGVCMGGPGKGFGFSRPSEPDAPARNFHTSLSAVSRWACLWGGLVAGADRLSLPLGTAGQMGAAHPLHLSRMGAGTAGCGQQGAAGSSGGGLGLAATLGFTPSLPGRKERRDQAWGGCWA